MPSRAGRFLAVVALLWISVAPSNGIPQSANEPQSQSQSTPSEAARQWYLLGDAADRAGNKQEAMRDYEESIKAYREAISRNPGYAVLWRNLGFVYWVSDQREQAIAAYREAVRLQPDDAESHAMLGNLQSSDPDAAIMEYRQAVRLKPSEARYHFDLGLALAQKSEFTSAIEEIQEASRLDPQNGEIHLALGEVLQKQGDVDGAISEYRKALALELTSVSDSRARSLLTDALAKQGKGNSSDPHYWIKRLEDWREATAQHQPGASDAAAVLIGSWPVKDLEVVIGLIGEATGRPLESNRRKHEISWQTLIPTIKNRFTDDGNRILKRGVLLHTDIALLQLGTGVNDGNSSTMLSIKDGRTMLLDEGRHWEFARRLLDSIDPGPSRDGIVKQWYIAATAQMLNRGQFAYAETNLQRALKIFPSDAVILFYRGAMHETCAAPAIQNALAPPGVHFRFGSRNSELSLARHYLQNAVAVNPKFAEAHLRLGRVMGLLGKHDQAVVELQAAAVLITDPQFEYYASLCLGNELAMLRRNAEACEQFERAARLFPAAQSPLLALSHLARSSGDSESALRAIQEVFSLPAANSQLSDPWWDYDRSHVRNSAALVDEVRKSFGGVER